MNTIRTAEPRAAHTPHRVKKYSELASEQMSDAVACIHNTHLNLTSILCSPFAACNTIRDIKPHGMKKSSSFTGKAPSTDMIYAAMRMCVLPEVELLQPAGIEAAPDRTAQMSPAGTARAASASARTQMHELCRGSLISHTHAKNQSHARTHAETRFPSQMHFKYLNIFRVKFPLCSLVTMLAAHRFCCILALNARGPREQPLA